MKHKDFTQQSCSARDKEDLSSSHVNVCTGCPKKIPDRNQKKEQGDPLHLEQMGKGLHCEAKTFLPRLLLAAATTHSDVKLC